MADWDWKPYLRGGATRPDAISGLKPEFNQALQQMFASAPENIRSGLSLSSAYRSPERQAELWEGALQKYGSPEAARKWVAPPGRSNHNHGQASDLKYLSPEAKEWAHANASKFGLAFPLSNEDWHVELASARGGDAPKVDPTTPVASTTAATPQGLTLNSLPAGISEAPTVAPEAPVAAAAPPSTMDALSKAMGDEKGLGGALDGLMKGLSAGKDQPQQQSQPLQNTVGAGFDQQQAALRQGAAQLMATLMAGNKRPGMTLNSMVG